METAAEREQRIARLEANRATRATAPLDPTIPDPGGFGSIPVEIAPGRGNLNLNSQHWPQIPAGLRLLGPRNVSFSGLFQTQPWVAAAVMRMLTWSIRVPLRVYRHGDDPNDRTPLGPKDHPLARAVNAPWNRAGTAQLVQAMLGGVLVHGNSTIRVLNGAQDAISFQPKDWRFCAPIMPFRDELAGFTFDLDAPAYRQSVSIDEILHTAWWSPTGPIGTSPLQQLGITLQIEDAAQRYQRSTFQNGARPPSAIVASEEFLSLNEPERKQIMEQLRADIMAIYSGPDNGGKPALLPPGLDWKPIGQTTVEAALVDQRKVAREEVCAVYLIPPPLMGILDRATYSNIQVQRDMTYTDCLGPPLVLLEQALNSQVVREMLREEDDIFVEFDFAAVLRGDRLQEIEAIRNATTGALMSPNEGRGILGFPKVDDDAMDQFYLPTVNELAPITGEAAETAAELAAQQAAGGGTAPPAVPPGEPVEDPDNAPVDDNPTPKGGRILDPALA